VNAITLNSSVEFVAAKAGDSGEAVGPVRFTVEAYTGSAIRQGWSREPVVIDLAGMQFKQQLPIVLGHDYSLGSILGQTTSVRVDAGKLIVEGEILASGETADRVIELAKRGYQWQASVGADVRRHMKIDAEKAVEVNGQAFAGPVRIVKASALREVSFVPLGADAETRVSIAAEIAETEELMADNANEKPADDRKIAAEAPANVAVESPVKVEAANDSTAAIAVLQAKLETMEKLLATRNERAPAIHVAEPMNGEKVIEAALCLQAGLPNADKAFDGRTLEAGEKARRSTSLGEVLVRAAAANGYDGSHKVSTSSLPVILRAAFATHQISDLLSNVANKFLLSSFNAVERTWADISATRSVSDFKAITMYRLNGSFKFKKLSPAGQMKLAQASDEKRSLSADTYAIATSLTRNDMVNDDLGALTQIMGRMGRGAALSLNEVIWGEFLDGNSTYFQAATPGSGNALSLSSLKSAATAFRKLKDSDGNPLAIPPRVLLVPPELELTAAELMTSNLLISGNTSSQPSANVMAGRYRVVVSSYLTSATTWWLLSDASDLNALDVAFLNGQQTPTIEQAAVDWDTLGIGMRGFMDFGVSKAESLSCYRMATA
jgi:phage head maturation protease